MAISSLFLGVGTATCTDRLQCAVGVDDTHGAEPTLSTPGEQRLLGWRNNSQGQALREDLEQHTQPVCRGLLVKGRACLRHPRPLQRRLPPPLL
jgi:hypothetical protein